MSKNRLTKSKRRASIKTTKNNTDHRTKQENPKNIK